MGTAPVAPKNPQLPASSRGAPLSATPRSRGPTLAPGYATLLLGFLTSATGQGERRFLLRTSPLPPSPLQKPLAFGGEGSLGDSRGSKSLSLLPGTQPTPAATTPRPIARTALVTGRRPGPRTCHSPFAGAREPPIPPLTCPPPPGPFPRLPGLRRPPSFRVCAELRGGAPTRAAPSARRPAPAPPSPPSQPAPPAAAAAPLPLGPSPPGPPGR